MLAHWEPFGGIRKRGNVFHELSGMQQEMNRLFEDFFGEQRAEEGNWMPAIDVSETENETVVRAELPGMTQDDIELNLQENVLTLKGEKRQEKNEEGENFHRIERTYGKFSRSFSIPAGVKSEDVKATFKDGVLTITLPKPEEIRPKKIEIL